MYCLAHIIGIFRCERDGDLIYVQPNAVITESHSKFITTRDKVENIEDCTIVDSLIFLAGRKECVPFKQLSGDSIAANVYSLDTLFFFKENEVAKQYKGHLYLKILNSNDLYMTFQFSLQDDGAINWKMIDVPDNTIAV